MPGYRQISEELHELLSLLNSHHVDFVVVGSHALAFHGVPRFTEDIDFFVSRQRSNIVKLASALKDFGIDVPDASIDEMSNKDRGVIFIGNKPNRADFLNFLDGVEFDEVYASKVPGSLAGESVSFISVDNYIKTKKASGRPKDRSDLILLWETYPDLDEPL